MNITCSALPENLLESELFGHERGAFTGADRQKRGLFETADGGTVFLDEIGEMVPALQAKLLRFLEETDVQAGRRVGRHPRGRARHRGHQPQARRRSPAGTIPGGPVLPAQRGPHRAARRFASGPKDIPLLLDYYIDSYNTEFKKRVEGIAPEAIARLQTYGWPGNIRELRNAVERAMLLGEGKILDDRGFLDDDGGGAISRRASSCRPTASISNSSSARSSSRRSSEAAGTRRAPRRCSASTAIRSATGSRSSSSNAHLRRSGRLSGPRRG